MLTTDELFLAQTHLSTDEDLRQAVCESLASLLRLASYRAWHDGLAQAQPFVLPDASRTGPLQQAGLASATHLLVRVNEHAGKPFVTDGTWTAPQSRVFPFNDESLLLLDFAKRHQLVESADLLVDLAAGCGHTAWAVDVPRRVCLDINPRALAYAELNRMLVGLPAHECLCVLNDIRNGVPDLLQPVRRALVVGNLPFGLAAAAAALPMASNGGQDGLSLQQAALASLATWRQRLPPGARLNVLLLGLSPGDSATDRWVLHDKAVALFGAACTRWHVLHEEQLARANARRVLPNPCPLQRALPFMANCQLYTPDAQARHDNVVQAHALARQHAQNGNPDLAYGLLRLELR